MAKASCSHMLTVPTMTLDNALSHFALTAIPAVHRTHAHAPLSCESRFPCFPHASGLRLPLLPSSFAAHAAPRYCRAPLFPLPAHSGYRYSRPTSRPPARRSPTSVVAAPRPDPLLVPAVAVAPSWPRLTSRPQPRHCRRPAVPRRPPPALRVGCALADA